MRKPRQYSTTGFYHIVIRGNNKQNIFFNKEDRFFFLHLLRKYSKKYCINIHAYCLMENHVHLEIEDYYHHLSIFMQCLSSTYARYFNKKYDRIGHLFQERFASEIILKKDYFLAVLRYILQNPLKAGISIPSKYEWSSYKSYAKKNNLIQNKLIIEYFISLDKFYSWINEYTDDIFLDERLRPSEKENNYLAKIKSLLKTDNPIISSTLPKNELYNKLRKLRNAGIPIKAIERITGISRYFIIRA